MANVFERKMSFVNYFIRTKKIKASIYLTMFRVKV